jgi:hypothetical protein
MADIGATYDPGEEPRTTFDYFMQNLGASSIPMLGVVGKTSRMAIPLFTEASASAGGAVGGKAMQQTEWGQQNPELARAAGELTGGLMGASPGAVGRVVKSYATQGPPLIRAAKAPMRGAWARKRAARSIGEQAEDPEGALRSLQRSRGVDEEAGLTAAQKTDDPGIAAMRRQVEADLGDEARFGRYQQSRATQGLKSSAVPSEESGEDVQQFLEETLRRRGEEAQRAVQRAARTDDPATYNAMARQKIEQAYEAARKEESRIWGDLPEGKAVKPTNTIRTYKEEVQNITEGGDLNEVDKFAQRKLGKLHKATKPAKSFEVGNEETIDPESLAFSHEIDEGFDYVAKRGEEAAKDPIITTSAGEIINGNARAANALEKGEDVTAIQVDIAPDEAEELDSISAAINVLKGNYERAARDIFEGHGQVREFEDIANILRERGEISEEAASYLKSFKLDDLKAPSESTLAGGELIGAKKKSATPKALHQFYSQLGRRVRKLSEEGGNSNKIRILNRLRSSILDDLEMSDVGDEYRKAIEFSKRLNEKFTSGSLGKVLGFQRGQATPETMTLDDLIGAGKQQARERLRQVLDATPQAEEDIKDFIRSRFAMQSIDEKTGRINSRSGQKFLKQNRNLLDAFPDLKKELGNAVQKQKRVDQLVGVSDVSEMSPLAKQKAAASLYLGKEDPNDALKSVISSGKKHGRTTQYFKELKQQVGKDPTGKAQKGLKNAVVSELLEHSRRAGKEAEDPVTAEQFISGRIFLKRLGDLERPLTESGLMTKEQVDRLKRIGQAFRKLETEQQAGKAGMITTDAPGRLLDTISQIVGAQIGGKLGATSTGGSLQFAEIASSRMKQLMRSITADEARNLLIKATRDDQLMQDLLKDWQKLSAEQQQKLATRVWNKTKSLGSRVKRRTEQASAPAGAVSPPLVSAGREAQGDVDKQRLKRRLQNMRATQPNRSAAGNVRQSIEDLEKMYQRVDSMSEEELDELINRYGAGKR